MNDRTVDNILPPIRPKAEMPPVEEPGVIGSSLKFNQLLMLQAFKVERNKTQAQRAIEQNTGIRVNMGRYILPICQQMLDNGLIERTNSKEVRGHTYLITSKGEKILEGYYAQLVAISEKNPDLGF